MGDALDDRAREAGYFSGLLVAREGPFAVGRAKLHRLDRALVAVSYAHAEQSAEVDGGWGGAGAEREA